jgi:stress response protein YsnF
MRVDPGMDRDRDTAMTRSEEELTADTVWRPAERVRVRRRVVEEEVVVAVTVRREELEVVREPASRFDPPRRDAGEPAEVLVMVLHEERPVVGVEVVPTEVVRVYRTAVHGGERSVTGTVRREQIEIERT